MRRLGRLLEGVRTRLRRIDLRGWRQFGHVKPLLGSFGFIASLVPVVLLIHREVYSIILERSDYSVRLGSPMAAKPDWSKDRMGFTVESMRGTLLDEGLVKRIAADFAASPWVRRVLSVRRVFPRRITVEIEFRRPFLAVKQDNGYILLDRDLVRLPGTYSETAMCDISVPLTGVPTKPACPGEPWIDESIVAGREMARLVSKEPLLKHVRVCEIDVSNIHGRLDRRQADISLICANGCTIYWGSAPAHDRFWELPIERKLDNLRTALNNYPRLNGLRYVKIYTRDGPKVVEGDTRLGGRSR